MVTSRWEKNRDRRDLEAMCEIYNENLGKTEGLENAAIKLSEDSELCNAEMATLVDPLIPFEVPKRLTRELFNKEEDYNFALAQRERISNHMVRRGIIRRYRMDKSPSYGRLPLIRTKTIEIAWNFSKISNDSPINLYGQSSMLVDSRAFNTFGWIELPDDERRSRWNSYWLRTTDGSIRKVGISSSARWQFTGRSVSHHAGLSFVEVWSKRIKRSGIDRDFVPNFVRDFALDSN
ncbi:hypothetical protein BS50DRAFT_582102 [Corynespora cassiicola Philippines]|uniref:Uncharacterized protein n=1 Tax=Corynespora cassiicola Philippines TaxID=1448308 RepID=A0A2T2PDG9_CORCC|nr:hypothetical protein BS50DRAFT_582102 [Corynespora cassiicola Philippines]